jgi:hypothetical protein
MAPAGGMQCLVQGQHVVRRPSHWHPGLLGVGCQGSFHVALAGEHVAVFARTLANSVSPCRLLSRLRSSACFKIAVGTGDIENQHLNGSV